VSDPEIRYYGKYIIVYEKGRKDDPDYGSLSHIQSGDVVCICNEDGNQSLTVEKIAGSKWTRKIITKQRTYHGFVTMRSITVDLHIIRRVLRLKPGETHAPTMEECEQEQNDKLLTHKSIL